MKSRCGYTNSAKTFESLLLGFFFGGGMGGDFGGNYPSDEKHRRMILQDCAGYGFDSEEKFLGGERYHSQRR